ncbi:hypothetical protein Ahy_B03g064676 [Arachis hypogaea]|uniref:Aminotransferase-like plant mobile domain-containing protein n=1 Tax=Arachis hypogaea TaxID=3818 RepID=A0A445A042_ARAHY|nr:hypothetical protein Ahy_B03g064676 [Arachis hypogaea]
MKKTMVTKKEKPRYNKAHDLRCQTKTIARVFKAMSQEKKYIVEEMRFAALEQVPEMNVSHSLLRELIAFYDDYYGCLNTLHGKIYITPDKVAALLGINHRVIHFPPCAYFGDLFPENVNYGRLNEADKQIIDGFKCVTLASLTKSVLDMSVEGEKNRQKFQRTFVIFVQKCFLLPTTVSMASPIHKPSALRVANIRQWDWANHVLSFLRKGIENRRKGKNSLLMVACLC